MNPHFDSTKRPPFIHDSSVILTSALDAILPIFLTRWHKRWSTQIAKRGTHLASRSIASSFCFSLSAARRLMSATCCVVGNPRCLMKATTKRQSEDTLTEQRPTNSLADPRGQPRPHDDWRLAADAPQSHSLCSYLEGDGCKVE